MLVCVTWKLAIFFIVNSFYATGNHYLMGALVICYAGCPIAGWLAYQRVR